MRKRTLVHIFVAFVFATLAFADYDVMYCCGARCESTAMGGWCFCDAPQNKMCIEVFAGGDDNPYCFGGDDGQCEEPRPTW